MADSLTMALLAMFAAVAGIGGVYLAVRVRRWSRREEPCKTFTLQDLREMRARDEINDQEFQALRAEIISRAAQVDQASDGSMTAGQ